MFDKPSQYGGQIKPSEFILPEENQGNRFAANEQIMIPTLKKKHGKGISRIMVTPSSNAVRGDQTNLTSTGQYYNKLLPLSVKSISTDKGYNLNWKGNIANIIMAKK